MSVAERLCRCSPDPHPLTPSCYLPGRPPLCDGPQQVVAVWDLDARLTEADYEGYQRGLDAAEDCDQSHCPEDCGLFDGCHDECLDPDDGVVLSDALDKLSGVTFTRATRKAVAAALGVDVGRVGIARSRGVRQ